MGIPTNIGGWGPREGAAASAAGLGADQGVATAVVYGVMGGDRNTFERGHQGL